MLFRDFVSMLIEEVILAMNGEVTIAKLFAKFGRRFAMIIEPDHDQVYIVIFYEIVFNGYKKYIKRSTVKCNQKNCMLIVPGFADEYGIIDAVDLDSHVENMLLHPLLILDRRASKKSLRTAENLRKLSSALFKYEQAREKTSEEFIEKKEEMRKGIINLIVKTCENV